MSTEIKAKCLGNPKNRSMCILCSRLPWSAREEVASTWIDWKATQTPCEHYDPLEGAKV